MKAAPLILVVDDDPLLQRATVRLLSQADYRTCAANDGQSALCLARSAKPDLILLDVVLPDIAGFDVCRQVKDDPTLTGCLVAMLSGSRVDSASQIEGLDGGADGYITRPVSNGELLARVRGLLRIKHAEDRLRESEARYRSVAQSAADAIVSIDSAGNIVSWNLSAERLFGYSEAEISGQPLIWLLPLRYRAGHVAGMAQVDGARRVVGKTVEVEGRHKDGHEFPLELSLAEWQVVDKTFYTAIIRDITDRKAAEDQLRLLSRAVEHSPTSIVMTDPTGAIIYVNPQFEAVTGYTAREVIGQNPHLLKSGHTSEADYADLWHSITHGQTWHGEFVNKKKSGELYWESASISPVMNAQGQITHFVAVKEDITDRKRLDTAEREQRVLAEALRDTAAALNSTLHLADLFERILDNVGRVVAHDTASIMLIDSTRETAYMTQAHEQGPAHPVQTHPLQRVAIRELATLQRMIETGRPVLIPDTAVDPAWVVRAEATWQRSYLGAPMIVQGQVMGFLNINSATPGFYTREHAERLQAFADQAAVALNNALLYDQVQRNSAELEQRVAQRTRELTAANERLTELDRLKDDFVSRISHELRTPLTSIRIYLELLEHGKPEKQVKYKDILNRESVRLQMLIEDLLHIQRIGDDDYVGQIQAVKVNPLIMDLLAERADAARDRQLSVCHDLTAELPLAATDPTLAQQAIANILKNALDYTPRGGQIILTTKGQVAVGQHWVTITVADTGPGISAEDRPHIFERFYRGAAARDYTVPGTGLGLAISQDIVHKLGGHLTLDSEPELGAVFTVWLPVAPQP